MTWRWLSWFACHEGATIMLRGPMLHRIYVLLQLGAAFEAPT